MKELCINEFLKHKKLHNLEICGTHEVGTVIVNN